MTSNEKLQYSWDHADPTLVSTVPRTPRYYDGTRIPIYPTYGSITEIHPEIDPGLMIRVRGMYWFTTSQNQLEIEEQKGIRQLEEGVFYCFLEEEYQEKPLSHVQEENPIMIRYGNVFMHDHWVYKTVAIRKDHPDCNEEPYKMVNVF